MYSNERRLILQGMIAAAMSASVPGMARAQAGAKPITVKFQDFGTNPLTTPYNYIRSEGLFEKNGINAVFNPSIYNAGGIWNVAVQGQCDIAYSGANPVISLAQQGRQVKIIAVIAEAFEIKVALVNRALDDLAKKGITPASPLNARVQALKGMRIVSPAAGSTSDLGFRYVLRKYGMDPNRDVIIQPLPDLAALVAAVRQGAVDGIQGSFASGVGQIQSEGFGKVFIEFEKHDKGLATFPFNVLGASDEYIKTNPEAIRRVLTAFQGAKQAIRRGLNEGELMRIKKQFMPDMKEDVYLGLVKAVTYQLTGPMAATREQFDTLLGIVNAVAETPAKVTYEQCFDTRIAESVERK
jgi:NitT/TauT family transport system substrate-binding protein